MAEIPKNEGLPLIPPGGRVTSQTDFKSFAGKWFVDRL